MLRQEILTTWPLHWFVLVMTFYIAPLNWSNANYVKPVVFFWRKKERFLQLLVHASCQLIPPSAFMDTAIFQVSTGQAGCLQWSQRAASSSWWASWWEGWSTACATLPPRLWAPTPSSSSCSRQSSWTQDIFCPAGFSLKTSGQYCGQWRRVCVCVCVYVCVRSGHREGPGPLFKSSPRCFNVFPVPVRVSSLVAIIYWD